MEVILSLVQYFKLFGMCQTIFFISKFSRKEQLYLYLTERTSHLLKALDLDLDAGTVQCYGSSTFRYVTRF